ncbi:hypothetical protein ZEAMMB73_Zm00001d047383 [Zea mays]|uniref:Uncharacterized protein n=1 Tax=Zea mays TaxID=4577 RepID=A0A1D6P926_MAIZE|nr:hypothetical protein ZEAMMB73_Zm00001d047383 [Zea mays]
MPKLRAGIPTQYLVVVLGMQVPYHAASSVININRVGRTLYKLGVCQKLRLSTYKKVSALPVLDLHRPRVPTRPPLPENLPLRRSHHQRLRRIRCPLAHADLAPRPPPLLPSPPPPPPPASPLRPLLPPCATPLRTRWDLGASRPPLQSTSTTHAFFSGPTSKSRGRGHSLGGAKYGDGVLARSCPSSMTPSSNAPNPHALSPKRQAPGDTVVYLSPAYLLSSHIDIQAAVAKAAELRALHASLLQSGSAAAYNVRAYASCSPPIRAPHHRQRRCRPHRVDGHRITFRRPRHVAAPGGGVGRRHRRRGARDGGSGGPPLQAQSHSPLLRLTKMASLLEDLIWYSLSSSHASPCLPPPTFPPL